MSTAPRFDIDLATFQDDPYPTLARMRAFVPIAYVPQLSSTLLTRRDDISRCEKMIDVFSSDQPAGLMQRLMGHNMMRKDGEAHMAERRVVMPALSPRRIREHWLAAFEAHADRLLDALAPRGCGDLVGEFALPFSGACLASVTGLTDTDARDIDAWSRALIAGIANYAGDADVEARCRDAVRAIDAAIDARLPAVTRQSDPSMLGAMVTAGLPLESVKANIRLAISGGQNEPRKAIAGTVWALLTHSGQLAMVRAGRATWLQAFEEYARWISPIGMSPRRIARPWTLGDIALAPEDRVFLMFGSANRDEAHFPDAHLFDITRDTTRSVAFGAGPHVCAGAWVSRAMIAEVALPRLFARLRGLRLDPSARVRMVGWAFRGPLALSARWDV
jgi:hypothetical protein